MIILCNFVAFIEQNLKYDFLTSFDAQQLHSLNAFVTSPAF